MKTINDFCLKIKNKYPNTKEVLEQIEEIRSGLNIKFNAYQDSGLNYEDSLKYAIDSLGDIDELFLDITTDVINTYKVKAQFYSITISSVFLFIIMNIYSFLYAYYYQLANIKKFLCINAILFLCVLIYIIYLSLYYTETENIQ